MTVAAHQFLNPESMAPPLGFSHVAVAAPGRLVFLAGQSAHQADGTLAGSTLADQFAAAAANVAAALAAAGAT
ncbi:MAG TPA: Rid family hydrolase, partial [Acidimicrobiia bacterium]|nr:Rid family hydrolase [Acidimicrobiia bacterium]